MFWVSMKSTLQCKHQNICFIFLYSFIFLLTLGKYDLEVSFLQLNYNTVSRINRVYLQLSKGIVNQTWFVRHVTANQIHKLVTLTQCIWTRAFLQSAAKHHIHHTLPSVANYIVVKMTNDTTLHVIVCFHTFWNVFKAVIFLHPASHVDRGTLCKA